MNTLAKQAEEKIWQNERELQQILDLAPQHITVLAPDGSRIYGNQAEFDYYGLTPEEWRSADGRRYVHPDDWERISNEAQRNFASGSAYETEGRLLRKDGTYRWFVFRLNPLRDEQGRIGRWYVAKIDIEDRKEAEQRLQHENIALREEIDKASMFEEIVGTSPSLQTVLSRIRRCQTRYAAIHPRVEN